MLMGVVEPASHLGHHVEFAQHGHRFLGVDDLLEIDTVEELHSQELGPPVLAEFVDGDDVGVL